MKEWKNPKVANLSVESTKNTTYALICDTCGHVLHTWQRAPFPCQNPLKPDCKGMYVFDYTQES